MLINEYSEQAALAEMGCLYNSPMGRILYETEQVILKQILPHYFGNYLIQLGGPSDLSWLSTSPIRYHYHYNMALLSESHMTTDCIGDFLDIPFATDSADMILMPHTCELMSNYQHLLTEVERCLVPEGILILLNFVPYRLWYWQRTFRCQLPHLHWHNLTHIQYSLKRHHYQIEKIRSFFHRPYKHSMTTLRWLRFMEPLGKTLWPWMGNIQLIIARKKRLGVTPIMNISMRRPRLLINTEITSTIRTQP